MCAAAQQPEAADPRYTALAERLISASGDTARAALIAASSELANPKLVQAVKQLADRVYDRRDFEHAAPTYGVCVWVARQTGDRPGEGACGLNRGISLAALFRMEEAVTQYQQALAVYEALDSRSDIAGTLNSLGIALLNSGKASAALPHEERALAMAEQLQDPIAIARSSLNLGNVYHALGRYRDALRSEERALQLIRDRPGFARQVGLVLNNIASIYFDQHETELALRYHQQALAVKEKANSAPGEIASSVENIGTDLVRLRRPQEAIPYLERALGLTEGPGELRGRALALYNYGDALYQLKRPAEAREKLNAAVEAAARLGNEGLKAEIQILLAELDNNDGRYDEALALVQPGIEYGRRESDPLVLGRADEVAGVALRGLGRLPEAEAAAAEAIRAAEQQRRELPAEGQALARFLGGQAAFYQLMVQIQLDRHRPDLALAWAERSKARVLLDVLQSGGTAVTKALSAPEQKEEAERAERIRSLREEMVELSRRPTPDRARLAELSREMEDARTGYRAFELAMYAAHPDLKFQRAAFEPASPADLAAAIPEDGAAMLEYEFTDASASLFVITRAAAGPEIRVYALPVRKEALIADVQRFREQIANRDLGYRRLAASLYRELLRPAEEQLRGKHTLVIVPDGELWQLPFQALQTSAGRYLIEEYGVFYTPSLTVLREMERLHQAHSGPRRMLLAVNAGPTATARREAAGLRSIYGPDHVRVYAGPEADHDRVKQEAPRYQILHLAAHGVFDDRHPMDSYLVLAKDGKPEAGVLQAREMMNLNLSADMVVLSGCETGRGSFGSGEGLIGMSWTLFIAGAPATVASQWKVEAESTTDFMLAFHRSLRHESKVKAIQQAALDTMRNPQFRHPFYWAGFMLMGEGM